jgi:hypothetical protein
MIDYDFNSGWVAQYKSLTDFISQWFNIEKSGSDIEFDCSLLPLSLLQFYGDYGNEIEKIFRFNRFAQYREYCKTKNSMFLAENQGVYLWKVQTFEDNPVVLISENVKPYDWVPEDERLCGFIYQMVVFEAMMASKYGFINEWIDSKDLQHILEKWTACAFKPMMWPAYPARLYYNDMAIAFVCPNKEGFTFQCGSNDSEKLSFMKAFVDDSWYIEGVGE